MVKYKYSSEQLREAVRYSKNFSDVARFLGTKAEGSRVQHLQQRIKKEKIDTSHFTGRKANNLPTNKIPPEEILIKDRYSGRRTQGMRIRKAMLEVGTKEICSECGVGSRWNNKNLTLQVDHINGDSTDNQLRNLRLLCPNCHSQTDTHSFKNTESWQKKLEKKRLNEIKKLQRSGKKGRYKRKFKTEEEIRNYYKSREKFEITREELERLVWEKATVEIAKIFGVSDNAVGRRCKNWNIKKPPRGYWAKVDANKINRCSSYEEYIRVSREMV